MRNIYDVENGLENIFISQSFYFILNKSPKKHVLLVTSRDLNGPETIAWIIKIILFLYLFESFTT